MIKTYTELISLPTFDERFSYLKLTGVIGEDTFGFDRYLNQNFYKSKEWRHLRDEIIVRDCGYDLGVEGYDIPGKIIIHHMNPITRKDILDYTMWLTNPEYLITTSLDTHNAIHYGKELKSSREPITRRQYDTCPWRQS